MLIIYSLFQLVHDHDPWQLESGLLSSIWWKSISMSFQLFTRQWKVEESCVKFIAHNILLGRRLIVPERPTRVASIARMMNCWWVWRARWVISSWQQQRQRWIIWESFFRFFFFFSIRKRTFKNEKMHQNREQRWRERITDPFYSIWTHSLQLKVTFQCWLIENLVNNC